MITTGQLLVHLIHWNIRINTKIRDLNRASNFYRICYYIEKTLIAVFTALMGGLSSYLFGAPTGELLTYLAEGFLIGFQVSVITLVVLDKLIKFHTSAMDCIQSAKKYEELSREIEVKIDRYRNEESFHISNNHLQDLLFYSAREQLISEMEPFFYTFKTLWNPDNSLGDILEEINKTLDNEELEII